MLYLDVVATTGLSENLESIAPQQIVELVSTKKRRSSEEIIERVFKYKTIAERHMVAATLKAFDVGSATLKITSAQRETVVNINASTEDLRLLQTFNNNPIISVSTEVGSENQPAPNAQSRPFLNDHYLHSCLQHNYPGILRHTSFQEDKSQKLLISSLVFNALIMSSIPIDIKLPSEVGASTFNFKPSKETRLYLSSRSIKYSNATITEKRQLHAEHDINSTLRQVRSRFTNPQAYINSRFHSEWRHFTGCMPNTIFAIVDKPNVDPTISYVICSKVLLMVADAMRFSNGILEEGILTDIALEKKRH